MLLTPALRDSGNLLLDILPQEEYDLLAPTLEAVDLDVDQVVHQLDVEVDHVHFPTTALVSLLAVPDEDDPVEVATVGKEGFVGLAVPLGVAASTHCAICRLAGDSLRLPAHAFLDAMARGAALDRLVHRYIAFTLRTAGHDVACNALHQAESRVARWLLMLHDQAGRDEFPMTHEALACMLGLRRQTVTLVAGVLQKDAIIRCRRGVITILDHERLEEAACECHAAGRGYYERIVFWPEA